jgi:hypothetical protein
MEGSAHDRSGTPPGPAHSTAEGRPDWHHHCDAFQREPNRIIDIAAHGVTIETERTRRLGNSPQLVPAWMIQVAWNHLTEIGTLTNRELLSSTGLNVKRSSAVCALLAHLPNVDVESTRPIVLRLVDGSV